MPGLCVICGYPREEHSYNGACYGLCGKFEAQTMTGEPTEAMMPGPCVICGLSNYPLSMGGPTICPSCDCGDFGQRRIERQRDEIERLTRELDECKAKRTMTAAMDQEHARVITENHELRAALEMSELARDRALTEVERLRAEIADWRARLADQCGQTLVARSERDKAELALLLQTNSLRAEIERLKAGWETAFAIGVSEQEQNKKLRTENERLQADNADLQRQLHVVQVNASVSVLNRELLHWEHQNGLLENKIERLRRLVQCLLDEDPNDLAADGGVTVLDVWRKEARAVMEP